MTEGVVLCVCVACGHAIFPARIVCSRCGSEEWREERVSRGTVVGTTSARKRVIVQRLLENRLADVRTDAGPVVIVRLLAAAEPGTEVALGMQAGAIVAQPLER